MLTREMQYAILKVHRLCDGYLFRKENKKIGKSRKKCLTETCVRDKITKLSQVGKRKRPVEAQRTLTNKQ